MLLETSSRADMADRNDRAYVARKTRIADLQMMAYHLDAIAVVNQFGGLYFLLCEPILLTNEARSVSNA